MQTLETALSGKLRQAEPDAPDFKPECNASFGAKELYSAPGGQSHPGRLPGAKVHPAHPVQTARRCHRRSSSGEYAYPSSFSDTVVQNAGDVVRRLIGLEGLGPQSLAIEIPSNDGYLLQHYHHNGIPELGIEPAANIAQVAREERGIPTRSEFFGSALGEELAATGNSTDVVHGKTCSRTSRT